MVLKLSEISKKGIFSEFININWACLECLYCLAKARGESQAEGCRNVRPLDQRGVKLPVNTNM